MHLCIYLSIVSPINHLSTVYHLTIACLSISIMYLFICLLSITYILSIYLPIICHPFIHLSPIYLYAYLPIMCSFFFSPMSSFLLLSFYTLSLLLLLFPVLFLLPTPSVPLIFSPFHWFRVPGNSEHRPYRESESDVSLSRMTRNGMGIQGRHRKSREVTGLG